MLWPYALQEGGGSGAAKEEALESVLSVFCLACRLCALSKGLPTPARGLTQGSQELQTPRIFHIREGKYGFYLLLTHAEYPYSHFGWEMYAMIPSL